MMKNMNEDKHIWPSRYKDELKDTVTPLSDAENTISSDTKLDQQLHLLFRSAVQHDTKLSFSTLPSFSTNVITLRVSKKLVLIAASILVLFTVYLFRNTSKTNSSITHIVTVPSQVAVKQPDELPQKTESILPSSKIFVISKTLFEEINSGVHISSGSMLLHIRNASEKNPFTITTPHNSIIVTGTVLKVTVDDNQTEVSLIEGKAKIQSENEEIVLEPFHTLKKLSQQKTSVITPLHPENVQNYVVYIQELLSDSPKRNEIQNHIESWLTLQPKKTHTIQKSIITSAIEHKTEIQKPAYTTLYDAKQLLEKHDWVEAENVYLTFIKENRFIHESYTDLAMLYAVHTYEADKLTQIWKEYSQNYPNGSAAEKVFLYYISYFLDENLSIEKRDEILSFLKRFPQNPFHDRLIINVAQSLRRESLFHEAIQNYKKIISSSEFYVQAQFEIIQCHIENKNFSQAKILLEHFIKTFPESSFTKEAEKLRMQIFNPAFEKK